MELNQQNTIESNYLSNEDKKADILKKLYESKEIKQSIKVKKSDIKKSIDMSNVYMARELREMLSANIIDTDRTIIGGEPIFKLMMNGNDRKILMDKLIEVVSRF